MQRSKLRSSRKLPEEQSKANGYSHNRRKPTYKRWLTVDQVPEQYKERYLARCYRHPNSTALECVSSVFTLNNETFNIWTHLIPLVILAVYFVKSFPCRLWPVAEINPWYYPLLAEEIAALAYLLGSTTAHTFNCMSPRVRHMCFYLDYAAISMFGIGGACSTFFYLRPLEFDFFLFKMPNLYMGLCCACNILAVYLCCVSRHQWESSKYIVRTLAFALPYMYGNLISMIRVLECVFLRKECTISLISFVVSGCSYLIGAIFNSVRFPEKKYPRKFDVYGHSHQWMHIFTTIGTATHFWAVVLELDARKDKMEILLQDVSFSNSLGCAIGVVIITASMALWFGSRLNNNGELKSQEYLK